jgi:MmgE/PrpD N-terminal domain
VLDTIGVAIGALDAEPIVAIRELTVELGGRPLATLVGGGKTAPDRAAFFNGALSRYLDFMDSYPAKGETNHPSDNLAPVLATAEMRRASGADFLTALAVAYQVQTRYNLRASTLIIPRASVIGSCVSQLKRELSLWLEFGLIPAKSIELSTGNLRREEFDLHGQPGPVVSVGHVRLARMRDTPTSYRGLLPQTFQASS